MTDFIVDPEEDARALRAEDVDPDPLVQLARWYEEAVSEGVPEPDAMSLATATADGRPSARMVLFRGLEEGGLVFYTNYESRKGRELTANPRAAAVLYWRPPKRQIRVEGRVQPVSQALTDRYFRSRPPGSQLSAWASPQSEVIADRTVLRENLEELAQDFEDEDLPTPPFWGGYVLQPEVVELWQGRAHRLHDRLRYRREGHGWILERLAP